MPAAMLTPDRPPPEDYYQNNCRTLFSFVLAHYADLLAEQDAASLQSYLRLTDDAQRLFARLLTRKGPLIRTDSLNYAEISNVAQALDLLCEKQFICLAAPAPGDQLLAVARKAEVTALNPTLLPNSARKDAWVLQLLSLYTDRQVHERVVAQFSWLHINKPQTWQMVRLLYFGDNQQDWSAFVIRDLGMVRYEPWHMHSRRYESLQTLKADMYYRRLSELSRRLEEHPKLAVELSKCLQAQVPDDRFMQARRERTLLRIGRWHERADEPQAAVDAYRQVNRHPARERIVRLLHRCGDESTASQWLQTIRNAPLCEEEAQFAERFGKRQAGYQPPATQIDITELQGDIEQQALNLLLQPGEWGAHVENSLVRTLTGLVYWEVIFADVAGAFTNPFQSGPHDLYREEFLQPREQQLATLEAAVQADADMQHHLLDMFERKQGIANSLVDWQMFKDIALADIIDAMPVDDIRKLSHFLIRNLHSRRAGLPDLFVVHGPKHYELIEVKGPGDQLQPGQRVWFKHLARLGIPARVLRLRLVG